MTKLYLKIPITQFWCNCNRFVSAKCRIHFPSILTNAFYSTFAFWLKWHLITMKPCSAHQYSCNIITNCLQGHIYRITQYLNKQFITKMLRMIFKLSKEFLWEKSVWSKSEILSIIVW